MRPIIFVCLVAVSLAARKPQDDVTVLRNECVDQGDGNISYAFQRSDGTAVEVVSYPGEGRAVTIRGSYTYFIPDDGGLYTTTFEADEAGFRTWESAIKSVVHYSDDFDAGKTDLR